MQQQRVKVKLVRVPLTVHLCHYVLVVVVPMETLANLNVSYHGYLKIKYLRALESLS